MMERKTKVGEGEFETPDGKWITRTIWKEWSERYGEEIGRDFIIIDGRRHFRGKTRQDSSQFGKKYFLKHHRKV